MIVILRSDCKLYFTVLIHGEVSNDDGGGVSRRDEGYTRGGCIATGHWDWVSWSDANRTGIAILGLYFLFFGLCWWGRRWGPSLLQLEWSDLNNRIGVDFALGGGPGVSLCRRRVDDGCILTFLAWWVRDDTSQDSWVQFIEKNIKTYMIILITWYLIVFPST